MIYVLDLNQHTLPHIDKILQAKYIIIINMKPSASLETLKVSKLADGFFVLKTSEFWLKTKNKVGKT